MKYSVWHALAIAIAAGCLQAVAGADGTTASEATTSGTPAPDGQILAPWIHDAHWSNNNHLEVRALICNRPATFILDTSTPTATLLHPHDFFLDPTRLARWAPDGQHFFIPDVPADFGHGYETWSFELLAREMPRVNRFPDGALGWEQLRTMRLLIDWDGSVARLLDSVPKNMAGWDVFALLPTKKYAETRLPDGRTAMFSLGAADMLASVDSWPQLRRASIVLQWSETPGVRAARTGIVGEFAVGDVVFHDVNLTEQTAEQRAAVDGCDPVIGLYALREFNLLIDGPGMRLYLRRSKSPRPPNAWNYQGAVFLQSPSGLITAVVESESPAAVAGLSTGDEVLTYDGLRLTRSTWLAAAQKVRDVVPRSHEWVVRTGGLPPRTITINPPSASLQPMP